MELATNDQNKGLIHSNRLTLTLEKLQGSRAQILVQVGTDKTTLWEIRTSLQAGDSWNLEKIEILLPFILSEGRR